MPVALESVVGLGEMLAGLNAQADDLQRQLLANAALTEEAREQLDALPDLFLNVNADLGEMIREGAITAEFLAEDAVNTVNLIEGAVDGVILANGAVNTEHIAAAAIGVAQIGVAAIRTAAIRNLAVTSAKIESVNAGLINAGTINVALTLTAATITGGSLSIGTNAFNVNTSGQLFAGGSTFATADWRVDTDGHMTMTDGTKTIEIDPADINIQVYDLGTGTTVIEPGQITVNAQGVSGRHLGTLLANGANHISGITIWDDVGSGTATNHALSFLTGTGNIASGTTNEVMRVGSNGVVTLIGSPIDALMRWNNSGGSLVGQVYVSGDDFVLRNSRALSTADLYIQSYVTSTAAVQTRIRCYPSGQIDVGRAGSADILSLNGTNVRVPDIETTAGSWDVTMTSGGAEELRADTTSRRSAKTAIREFTTEDAYSVLDWMDPSKFRQRRDRMSEAKIAEGIDDPYRVHIGTMLDHDRAEDYPAAVRPLLIMDNRDDRDGPLRAEGFQYKYLAVTHVPILRDHTARIADLEARLAVLEGAGPVGRRR